MSPRLSLPPLRSGYEITPVVYFMDRDRAEAHTNNNNKLKPNRWTRCDRLARSAANQNTGIASSGPLAQPVIRLNVTFFILEEVYFIQL